MTSVEASPLQDIERRVQAQAKDTSLDMAGEGGKAKLRALIADEVAAWTATSPGTARWSRSWPTTRSGRSSVHAPDGAFVQSCENTERHCGSRAARGPCGGRPGRRRPQGQTRRTRRTAI